MVLSHERMHVCLSSPNQRMLSNGTPVLTQGSNISSSHPGLIEFHHVQASPATLPKTSHTSGCPVAKKLTRRCDPPPKDLKRDSKGPRVIRWSLP